MLRPFDHYRWQDHVASPGRSDLLVSVLISGALAAAAVCDLPRERLGPDAALALDSQGAGLRQAAGQPAWPSSPFSEVGTKPRLSRPAAVASPVLAGRLFGGCNGA